MQRSNGPLAGARRRVRRVALALAVGLAAWPGVASAHRLPVTRFDAPIPLGYLYASAAATVALTALFSARLVTEAAPAGARRTRLLSPRAARAVRVAVRALALLAFAFVLWEGVVGRQVRAENLATLVTWALVFDGLALVAATVGSPWRLLAPWRVLYDAVCRLEGERVRLLAWDAARLGRWPAVAGFALLVGVFENLTVVPDSPRGTVVLVAGYALAMFLGALALGEAWFDRADPVGVLLDLFGRVAPVRPVRSADGGYDLAVRAPWRALGRPAAGAGTAVFVVAAVYTISFDGFTNTPAFRSLRFGVVYATGWPSWTVAVGLYAGGLALFVLAVAGVVRAAAACAGGGGVRGGGPRPACPRAAWRCPPSPPPASSGRRPPAPGAGESSTWGSRSRRRCSR